MLAMLLYFRFSVRFPVPDGLFPCAISADSSGTFGVSKLRPRVGKDTPLASTTRNWKMEIGKVLLIRMERVPELGLMLLVKSTVT